jgi:cell division protein FtsB
MFENNSAASHLSSIAYFVIALSLGGFFAFSAVQGDFGVIRRGEIEADSKVSQKEALQLEAQVARMENLTHRLSDTFLDLDLLDERARDILGLMRHDELVID